MSDWYGVDNPGIGRLAGVIRGFVLGKVNEYGCDI